jgi:hypothetical protein
MAELKTKPTELTIDDFLNQIADEQIKKDCFQLHKMLSEVSGENAVIWSNTIVGYGSYQYKYATGRTGEWMKIGFSPRKKNITLYFSSDYHQYEELLSKIGKYKVGKGCFYINKLSDVNEEILLDLMKLSYNSKHVGEV